MADPYKISQKYSLLLLSAFYVFALATAYLTLLAPGSTFVALWLNDVMALLNGAYRVFQGQTPYLDFHTFYGPAVFYIPALGLTLDLQYSQIFAFNGIVVASILLLAGITIMSRRFSLFATLVTLTLIWLLIVVPLPSGLTMKDVTWAIFYNRHGWAGLILLFLLYVEPRQLNKLGLSLDVVASTTIVVFLIYTKITYGLVGLGFLVANVLIGSYNRKLSLYSFISLISVLVVIELFTGFHLEYLQNILATTGNNSFPRRGIWGSVRIALEHAWIVVACLGAIFALRAVGRKSIYDPLYALGAIFSSWALLDTSGGTLKGMPALAAVVVVFTELARREEIHHTSNVSTTIRHASRSTIVGGIFLLMAVIEPIGTRLLVWHDHYGKTVGHSKLQVLADTPAKLAGFLVAPKTEPESEANRTYDAPSKYMAKIIDGVALLKTVDFTDKRIFVFDNADPFSVALGLQPQLHGYPLLWTHGWTHENKPVGDELFRGADLIMISIENHREGSTPATLVKLYAEYLKDRFTEITRSENWRLLTRR